MINFRSLFSNRPSRSESRRRSAARQITAANALERLEDRTLLAGNVTAQLRGQNAFFNGDNADNGVEVLIEGGNVVARGTDGTTINGSTDDFVLAANSSSLSRSLLANLRGGNDTFVINGVNIARDAWINAGSGNDLVVLSETTIGRDLRMWGGSGNDDLVLDNSTVSRDVHMNGQGGDDDMVIRDSTVSDDLSISGHRGNDIFMLDGARVGDKTRLSGGSGADNIMIQGTTQFFDRVRAIGGRGGDNLEATAGVVFDGLKRRSFSGATIDTTIIETRITSPTTGALGLAEAAVGLASSELALTVDNAAFSEAAGSNAAELTVTRSASNTDADLVVTLTTSPADQTKFTLAQTSVTILAGETTATVAISAVDDQLIDSDTVVTITASATDLEDATVDITVTNDDIQTLTLATVSSDTVFPEDTGSGSTTGSATVIPVTVSRDGDTTGDLVVTLSTVDSDRLTVPATVIILDGEAQAEFDIRTEVNTQDEVDDAIVSVTAQASGAVGGNLQLTLTDNDVPFLSTEFAVPSISENENSSGGQTTLTVTRNTPTTDELVVSLSADIVDRFQFASNTLLIPIGESSESITVSGIDNGTVEGDEVIAVTASAAGFLPSSSSIFVTDDDVNTLTIEFSAGNTVDEDAGDGAIIATIRRNIASPTTALVVNLVSQGDSRLVVPTTATFLATDDTVEVALNAADNNLVDPTGLIATVTASAAGFVDGTGTVTVNEDDVATMTLVPSATSITEDAGDDAVELTITRNTIATAETISLDYAGTGLTGPATIDFAIGDDEQTVFLNAVDNSSFLQNPDVTITASAPGRADITTTIAVINDDVLTLTTDVSANNAVESFPTAFGRDNSLLTRDASFTVTGVTAPGATVQIESNGDGRFDDQTQIAGTDGSYSFDVPLTHTTSNNGANTFQVRSVVPSEGVDQISGPIDVHLAIGTVIRMQTNADLDGDGNLEFLDVELLDTDAPITVTNFLSYVNDGSYENMFIHRSEPGFVIQGGSFTVSDTVVDPIATRAAIVGEFSDSNSNLAGTLSMALTNGSDTGTSGWFFNIQDNAGLDAAYLDDDGNNNGHTVFGRLIGGGLRVAEAINTVSTADIRNIVEQQGLLGSTPLRNPPFRRLTGTIDVTADSNVLIGNGTAFTTELRVGDAIGVTETEPVFVTSIISDTELTVDLEVASTTNGLVLGLLIPPDDDYIIFTDIGTLLDQI